MEARTIVVGVVMNVSTVVGVVIFNKMIQTSHEYRHPVFMSAFHFFFTTIGTRVLLGMKFFEYKYCSPMAVLPVALGSLGSVAFNNLNLAHNSVGFYQISKLACIPATLVIQWFMYGQSTSTATKLTLIPLLVGMWITTVSDVEVNSAGLMYAVAAVSFTVFSQIFTSKYQKSLECDALQLLYHTSPMIAVGMLCLCPMFDDIEGFLNFEYHTILIRDIIISCCFALGVNVSNYLVLGKTGPLTYQVLGHLKTIMILVLGFYFFGKSTSWTNILGICIAMFGVVSYTEVKRRASEK